MRAEASDLRRLNLHSHGERGQFRLTNLRLLLKIFTSSTIWRSLVNEVSGLDLVDVLASFRAGAIILQRKDIFVDADQ